MAEKLAVILNPQRMGLAEQMRQDWIVNAEEGTTQDDIMEPVYWAHMASQMQLYDHVEVRLETGEWIAELIVTGVGRNWATMHMAVLHELAPPNDIAALSATRHKVVWRGAQHKHCVVRLSDKEVIQSGFPTAADAATWMQNYENTVAA